MSAVSPFVHEPAQATPEAPRADPGAEGPARPPTVHQATYVVLVLAVTLVALTLLVMVREATVR